MGKRASILEDPWTRLQGPKAWAVYRDHALRIGDELRRHEQGWRRLRWVKRRKLRRQHENVWRSERELRDHFHPHEDGTHIPWADSP